MMIECDGVLVQGCLVAATVCDGFIVNVMAFFLWLCRVRMIIMVAMIMMVVIVLLWMTAVMG